MPRGYATILSRLLRLTAMLLIGLMLGDSLAFAAKQADPMKIRDKVQSRGVGQGVRVTMADKTETKGVIVNISDTAFTVKPRGKGEAQEIQYAQVTAIHKDKMGTGTKVIIGVVIAAAVIGVTAIVIDVKINSGLKNITFCPNNNCTLVDNRSPFGQQ